MLESHPKEAKRSHQIRESLHQSDLTDKEIASKLNRLGIKTPSGMGYYELVFVTRSKMRPIKGRHSAKFTDITASTECV